MYVVYGRGDPWGVKQGCHKVGRRANARSTKGFQGSTAYGFGGLEFGEDYLAAGVAAWLYKHLRRLRPMGKNLETLGLKAHLLVVGFYTGCSRVLRNGLK